MVWFVIVCSIAMQTAEAPPQNDAALAAQSERVPGITAEFLYNGVNRPARITVVSPRSFGTVTLALMDADGRELATPIDVMPGIVDLAEKLPAIWSVRRTAYLQMIDGQTSVGSALVLQPMLSRMVPLTEVKPHPTRGTLHTSIIGWMDENEPQMQQPLQGKVQSPNVQSPNGGSTESSVDETAPLSPDSNPKSEISATADLAAARQNPKSVDRLFTGLRIYPERDVILRTTHGDIRLAMKPDEAPNTVWNFLELCQGGFYRDVPFHRIVPLTNSSPPWPFVIQAGDPSGTGDGGPGYWLPIEDSQLPHDFGVISMARNDDPDSNGSQFFIALSREGTARLDGQYCAFGYAVDGAQAIMDIAQVPLADHVAGRPMEPPLIKSAELVNAPPRMLKQGRPDERVTPESKPAEPRPGGRIPR